jgi:hypothetical protein
MWEKEYLSIVVTIVFVLTSIGVAIFNYRRRRANHVGKKDFLTDSLVSMYDNDKYKARVEDGLKKIKECGQEKSLKRFFVGFAVFCGTGVLLTFLPSFFPSTKIIVNYALRVLGAALPSGAIASYVCLFILLPFLNRKIDRYKREKPANANDYALKSFIPNRHNQKDKLNATGDLAVEDCELKALQKRGAMILLSCFVILFSGSLVAFLILIDRLCKQG